MLPYYREAYPVPARGALMSIPRRQFAKVPRLTEAEINEIATYIDSKDIVKVDDTFGLTADMPHAAQKWIAKAKKDIYKSFSNKFR